MALSHQDLFVRLLLGDKGYFVDIGAGNGEGEPCASNTSSLEERGWTGLLLEIDPRYVAEARAFRTHSTVIQADAFAVDYCQMFKTLGVPQSIDYLTIDIDPLGYVQAPCVEVLSRFPFSTHTFKILTIEHDLYNPHGQVQKKALQDFMRDKPFRLIVENVGLCYNGKKYLEDWYINPNFYGEFQIPNIDSVFYQNINPNDVILDLARRKYENSLYRS